MKIGMQMYTMRDYMQTERDMEYTLAKIAEIGYNYVQISGGGAIEPSKLRQICDSVGLKIVLTHTAADRILNETEKVIEEHNILGCDYIGLGAMPEKYRTDGFVQNFIETYKPAALKIKQAGKLFMYHNHAFEFEKFNGKTIMEMLAEGFAADEMGFTLDTYWVQEGGGDVLLWFDKFIDRIPCIHLKDMGMSKGEKIMKPIYDGNINFDGLLERYKNSDKIKYALYEQDRCEFSPFKHAEITFDNLIKHGWEV